MRTPKLQLILCALAALIHAQPPGGGPPGAGGQGDGIWLRNAYFGEAQTFDLCTGHQPNNGQYHYHANPICLRGQLNDNTAVARKARSGVIYREKAGPPTEPWTHSPILGWAFDGYPIYGPYAYSNPQDPSSQVRRMKPSYRLRSIDARTSLADWSLPLHTGLPQQLNPNQYGPAIGGQFPLGRYIEDFEFVSGLGDLDQYNGRFGVTPDFPQGSYAYFVTIDDTGAAAFPYILGGQFYGTVNGGNAQTISGAAQDYNAGSTDPLLASWSTRNAQQNAQVVSGSDPSAGPSTTWPGLTSPLKADIQRIRFTDSSVYINANGLASHTMGPWYDPLQPGGIFGNYPTGQNLQVQFPRTTSSAATKRSTSLGAQGIFVNGVALFNVLDGASYSNANGRDAGGGLVNPTALQVSAASFEPGPLAQGSLATALALFNTTLAASTATADSANWPTTLGGATVTVTDSAGVQRSAQIYYASPTQINYRIPPDTATGFGSVKITANGTQSSGNVNIVAVYPNLFTQSSDGQAAGYTASAQGNVYLVLAGTGIGLATPVTATIAGTPAQITYAGPQGTYPGLDQINILIPPALLGSGKADVVVTAGGKISNPVYVILR